MKTDNGAPQFDYDLPPQVGLTERLVNEQLREWADDRCCVKCINFDCQIGEIGMDKKTTVCKKIGMIYPMTMIMTEEQNIDVNTFWCRLFEKKV